MSKRIINRNPKPNGPVAVFTNYGTREHVECVTVVIQRGELNLPGAAPESRRFWSRDYQSPEELLRSAVDWAMAQGARSVAQVSEVFPLEECMSGWIRVLSY